MERKEHFVFLLNLLISSRAHGDQKYQQTIGGWITLLKQWKIQEMDKLDKLVDYLYRDLSLESNMEFWNFQNF